jgi:3-oxoacyl-[acyl-carrier protein] reductase
MTRGRFQGKSVIVTGAGSGIGLAAAEAFAAEGARLLLAGRSGTIGGAVKRLKKPGRRVVGFIGDLTKEPAARRLVGVCEGLFGRVDVLVNAAGVGRPGACTEIALSDWKDVVDNNLTNTFLCCREAAKVMIRQKSGAIVNVSSLAGRFRGGIGGAHYAASKAAVIGLTRQLAGEVARHNVRVNVSCPGPTETPMLLEGARLSGRNLESIGQAVPLGYVSSPAEQAQAILFLASEDASYVTGAALDVNGGIF